MKTVFLFLPHSIHQYREQRLIWNAETSESNDPEKVVQALSVLYTQKDTFLIVPENTPNVEKGESIQVIQEGIFKGRFRIRHLFKGGDGHAPYLEVERIHDTSPHETDAESTVRLDKWILRHDPEGHLVIVEGHDCTKELLKEHPELLEVRSAFLTDRGIDSQELKGVLMPDNVAGEFPIVFLNPDHSKTFLVLSPLETRGTSKVPSWRKQPEVTRSAYQLKEGKGYVQVKPVGLRSEDPPLSGNLPFHLSTPRKVIDGKSSMVEEFSPDTDLGSMFLEEIKEDRIGIIRKFLERSWEVINGMLLVEARAELPNGLRFAQLYQEVHGQLPDTQIPMSVAKIEHIFLPDGTVKPLQEVFVERLEQNPLEYEMLKIRLLQSRWEELDASEGVDHMQKVSRLQEYKRELNARDTWAVAGIFLEHNYFVQMKHIAPTYVRNSWHSFFKNFKEYNLTRLYAGEDASEQKVFTSVIEMYQTTLSEYTRLSGEKSTTIQYPDISEFAVPDEKDAALKAFGLYRVAVGKQNRELFEDILRTELLEMAKSMACINAVGSYAYASAWPSNMIGGRPADWDWNTVAPLPFEGEKREAGNFAEFLLKVATQNDDTFENIGCLLFLLGWPQNQIQSTQVELHSEYLDEYILQLKKARSELIFSQKARLYTEYETQLSSEQYDSEQLAAFLKKGKEEQFEQMIAEDPEHAEIRYEFGKHLEGVQPPFTDLLETVRQFQKAVQLEPRNWEYRRYYIRNILSALAVHAGWGQGVDLTPTIEGESEEIYRECITRDSDNAEWHRNDLVAFLLKQRRFQEALKESEVLHILYPHRPHYALYLAECYQILGNKQEASKYYREAIELQKQDPSAELWTTVPHLEKRLRGLR